MIERLRHIWPLGIRLQLMLWYTSIFAILLSMFSIIFYLTLQSALVSAVDTDLQVRMQVVIANITNDSGKVTVTDVMEELPRLDTNATGNISTYGPNQAGHTRRALTVNFGTLVRMLDARGRIIYVTPAFHALPIPPASVTQAIQGTPWHGNLVTNDGQSMRVYSIRIMNSGVLFGVIQIGETLTHLYTTLHGVVVKLLLLIAPFILICGAIGSYVLAARAFVPIHQLTDIAQEISAGDLYRRVPVPRPKDEVQHLALTFNKMIGRLNQSFAQQRRFVSDASHELRTPVAAIRGMTDVTLAQPPALEECVSVIRDVNTQAERLGYLINDLLLLARSDEGKVQLEREPVRLDLLVSDVVATLEPLAAERGISLQVRDLQQITVLGDTSRLIQSIINLLDNALTYTNAGGSVTLNVKSSGNNATLSIHDTGRGIASEHIPYIFERFYRADPARARGGGCGLGLAIVDWVVQVHGGSINVESQVGQGSTFTINLPLASYSSDEECFSNVTRTDSS